jgi:hypothetical protein
MLLIYKKICVLNDNSDYCSILFFNFIHESTYKEVTPDMCGDSRCEKCQLSLVAGVVLVL